MNKNFLAKLEAFVKAAEELDKEWSNLKGVDNLIAADSYPLHLSFDEIVNDLQQWEFTQRQLLNRNEEKL